MALGSIKGAEPSTVTFKLRTVTFDQNSTTMHSEVLVLGDPNTTNAIAAVLNAAPASTAWALAVRAVGTAAENPVLISGNSTVFQGGGAWAISGNSTVFQGSSAWQVQISNGNSSVTITAIAAGAGRINIGSTAADNAVVVSGNSTVAPLAGSLWTIQGNSTVAPLAGSTWATRPIQSSAADLQMTATPLAGSTWNVRALQSSAADLNASVQPIAGSTWRTQPGSTLWASSAGFHFDSSGAMIVAGAFSAQFSSTKADNLVTVYQSTASELNATVTPAAGSTWATRPIQSSAADLQVTATIGTNLQSSVAPSSNSSGLVVRQVIDGLTTFASTSALASTVLSCASSVANVRFYVTAYTITSTNQTPAQWGFYSSNATLLWPLTLAALSSATCGANLAVGAPSYLFRTAVNEALNFKTNGSTVISVQLGVSYFTAP